MDRIDRASVSRSLEALRVAVGQTSVPVAPCLREEKDATGASPGGERGAGPPRHGHVDGSLPHGWDAARSRAGTTPGPAPAARQKLTSRRTWTFLGPEAVLVVCPKVVELMSIGAPLSKKPLGPTR